MGGGGGGGPQVSIFERVLGGLSVDGTAIVKGRVGAGDASLDFFGSLTSRVDSDSTDPTNVTPIVEAVNEDLTDGNVIALALSGRESVHGSPRSYGKLVAVVHDHANPSSSFKIFVMHAGTLLEGLEITQDLILKLDAGQAKVAFAPTIGHETDWAGSPPTLVQAALDRMSALLKTLNGGVPIP